MSWFKKIGRKKETAGSAKKAANAADETVLFGSNAEPVQSRSSMISELAGLDPEISADLSNELEKQARESSSSGGSLISQYAGDDDLGSIDLDDLGEALQPMGAEDSALQATDVFEDDVPPLHDDDSGQQLTAMFTADPAATKDADSGQQETAIFAPDQMDTENSISLDDPQFASLKQSTAPPPDSSSGSRNAIPELDFDSQPGLDMHLDDGQGGGLSFDDLESSTDVSLIDQLAGGFDLDLSADEEPTMEIPSSSFVSPAIPSVDVTPTPKPEPDETPEPEPALDIPTAGFQDTTSPEQSIDFAEIATAKLAAPVIQAPPKVIPQEEPDDFDATVITTAAVAPAVAAGAEYVTGWVVVVDGPGKGQSRPIFSGINPIGRSPEQAIPLYFGGKSDGEISRRDHTRIVYDPRGNRFRLQHGASRNLTYLNDEAVMEIVDLNPYDRIGIGKTTLLFIPMCGDLFRW